LLQNSILITKKLKEGEKLPNIKRATIWGLILFLILFVILISLSMVFGVLNKIIGIFIIPFVIFLYSKFVYFRKEDTEASIKEGFLVGLYWLIIIIICDIIFVVYIMGFGWKLFSSWMQYVLYAEIVVCTILGALTEKK